jgi:hypothetical protein
LGVHPDAVRHAIETEPFHNPKPLGVSVVDPYIEFIVTLSINIRACARLRGRFVFSRVDLQTASCTVYSDLRNSLPP